MPNESYDAGFEGRIDTGGDAYSYQLGQQDREENENKMYSGSGDNQSNPEDGNAGLGMGLLLGIGAIANALEIIIIILISAIIAACLFTALLKKLIATPKSYKSLTIIYAIPFIFCAMMLWTKINSQLNTYKEKLTFLRLKEEIPPVNIKGSILLPYIIISVIVTGTYIYYINRKTAYFKGINGILKSVLIIAPLFLFLMFFIIYLIDENTIFSFHEKIPFIIRF